MFDSPSKWVKSAFRRITTPRSHRSANSNDSRPRSGKVGFVESTNDLWTDFVKHPDIQTLLAAPNKHDDSKQRPTKTARVLFRDATERAGETNDDTTSCWNTHLTTACRLFQDLEREAAASDDAISLMDVPNYYAQVISRLIKITYYQQHDMVDRFFHEEDPEAFVVHAMVGLLDSCVSIPTTIADYILNNHADQLRLLDPVSHKHLPLTMACVNGHLLFAKLLAAYPQAAGMVIPGSNDEYPLHVACRSNKLEWSTGISDLVRAAPDALVQNDPFVMAAMARAKNDNNDDDETKNLQSLETLYELLRHDPAVLAKYIVNE